MGRIFCGISVTYLERISGVLTLGACVTRFLLRERFPTRLISGIILGKKIVNSDVKQDTFRRAVGELLIGRISRRYCRVRHIACQT